MIRATQTLLFVGALAVAFAMPPEDSAWADSHESPLKIFRIEVSPDPSFAQVVYVDSGDARTIYVSGQVGESADLKSQSIEAFAGLEKRLAAAGAKPSDVVKITIFVVDYSPEKMADAFAGWGLLFKDRESSPAATLVGVQSLFQPRILIEVEAVAVVPV